MFKTKSGTLKQVLKNNRFFEKQNIGINQSILDLGTENPFDKLLKEKGFTIYNSGEVDLDLNATMVKNFDLEVVIALEIKY